MARVTITIDDQPGGNLFLEIEADPPLPVRPDGSFNIDDPDVTPAMAAAVYAARAVGQAGDGYTELTV